MLRAQLRVLDPAVRKIVFLFDERAVTFKASAGVLRFDVPLHGFEGSEVGLGLTLQDGTVERVEAPALLALAGDASNALWEKFVAEVQLLSPGKVLEIGARARSGTTYRSFIPPHLEYTGLDIVAGPNVDIVGDAHDLPGSLADASFELVFSIAVFEHLAMPWKAVLSINRVLADGGLVFVGTHQTFPVHEAPWDFWRFSDRAWHSLFNRATGFEVIATALGQPAEIVPRATLPSVSGIDAQPAFLTSSVLARKVGRPRVAWDVSLADLDPQGDYPN